MKLMNKWIPVLIISFTFLLLSVNFSIYSGQNDNKLAVNFNGDAQVEVGSHYVGAEFHHSSPVLERISFYYPVANSIDLSTDYWKRDTSCIQHIGLKIGDDSTELVGLHPFKLQLTPYYAAFTKKDAKKSIKISYNFCNTKPAMVVTYEITNMEKTNKDFTFFTHLETSVKTCHTYALIDSADTKIIDNKTVITNFNSIAVQFAQIFVANAGLDPIKINDEGYLNSSRNKTENYFSNESNKNGSKIPGASFLYKENLKPGQTMKVIQIIGSCKQNEGKELIDYLTNNYQKEVEDYKNFVLNYLEESSFSSGDKILDHSINWAKAILATNKHYIDGHIEPMPCPAEYNFYFSHDVLLSDLAAVNFDLPRVKQDLQYIVSLADSNYIIPHAYYWKDDKYVTEFADENNWNNYWFVITSSQYLNHSGDTTLLNKIYPFITKSLEQGLKDKKGNLIWAYRPDWWDIGHVYGARAYMTILAVRAIEEYVYTSFTLHRNLDKLDGYEKLAEEMTQALNDKLWNKNEKYVLNYYDKDQLDKHYYMGSLLSVVYNLLDKKREIQLLQTVDEKLLDPKLGVYAVYPMDFNKLITKWHFAGNEAGDPFMYINGGIWNHTNAWYTEALMKTDKYNEAYNFIKRTMTIDGIINSPNGQPAMYEYRIGDKGNKKIYGKVDKPQFMWAAAWYLNSIYHLYGLNESIWNISFKPFLPENVNHANFDIFSNGEKINVNIEGKGKYLKSIEYDSKKYSSTVIPEEISDVKNIKFKLGIPKEPYIEENNSTLLSCKNDNSQNSLIMNLKAFPGHHNKTKIISPNKPKYIKINGEKSNQFTLNKVDGIFVVSVQFIQKNNIDSVEIVD